MMAAMMFPSVAPTVALYSRMTQSSARRCCRCSSRPAISSTWGAVGRARVRDRARRAAGSRATCSRGTAPAAGSPAATLVVAAVYELTPLKDVCLGKCRSPLGFLLGSWRDGRSGALQMGAEERRLVRRLLLGADGVAVRARRHEHRLDGVRRRADRGREDAPVAPGRHVRDGRGPARARRARARRARRDPGAHDPREQSDAPDGAEWAPSCLRECPGALDREFRYKDRLDGRGRPSRSAIAVADDRGRQLFRSRTG